MSHTSGLTYVRESGGGGQYPHLFYDTVIAQIAEYCHKKPEELDEQTRKDALILFFITHWQLDVK